MSRRDSARVRADADCHPRADAESRSNDHRRADARKCPAARVVGRESRAAAARRVHRRRGARRLAHA